MPSCMAFWVVAEGGIRCGRVYGTRGLYTNAIPPRVGRRGGVYKNVLGLQIESLLGVGVCEYRIFQV